jgi:hypothetical protein
MTKKTVGETKSGTNEVRNNVQVEGTKVRKSTSMQRSLAAFLGASMVGWSVSRSAGPHIASPQESSRLV